MDKVVFSQIQMEKIEKGLNKALSISVVLENELGVQGDTVSANAVCVIKELVRGVLEIVSGISGDSNGISTGG